MDVVIRLLILSVNDKGETYVNVKDADTVPYTSIVGSHHPLTAAADILYNVCGINCLPEEFSLCDDVDCKDGVLSLTYCVVIPHNINNLDGKYKNVELNDFIDSDANEYSKRTLVKMVYKV